MSTVQCPLYHIYALLFVFVFVLVFVLFRGIGVKVERESPHKYFEGENINGKSTTTITPHYTQDTVVLVGCV